MYRTNIVTQPAPIHPSDSLLFNLRSKLALVIIIATAQGHFYAQDLRLTWHYQRLRWRLRRQRLSIQVRMMYYDATTVAFRRAGLPGLALLLTLWLLLAAYWLGGR